MKISIITDLKEYQSEIDYLCGLISSHYDVDLVRKNLSDYEPDSLMIAYCRQQVIPPECRIRIIPDVIFWESYALNEQQKGNVSYYHETPVWKPISGQVRHDIRSDYLETNLDLFASIFFWITRYEEVYNQENLDQHGRFCFTSSSAGKEYIHSPLVDISIKIIIGWLHDMYGIDIKPRNKGLRAVISHDIDIPFFFGTLKSELSNFATRLKKNEFSPGIERGFFYVKHLMNFKLDPYDTFDYMQAQEGSLGVRATYFILLSKDNAWGLNTRKYALTLGKIQREGNEIALHTGYDSYCDGERIIQERSSLEAISRQKIKGVRNHFLRFDIPQTYQLNEESGFLYDSTLGYAEHEGFRAGTCKPFKPYDVVKRKAINLVELPLTVMDCTLKDYCGYTPDHALEQLNSIFNTVAGLHGVVVLNWHNTFLREEEPAWRRVYEESLHLLADKGARFCTCSEVAEEYLRYWN